MLVHRKILIAAALGISLLTGVGLSLPKDLDLGKGVHLKGHVVVLDNEVRKASVDRILKGLKKAIDNVFNRFVVFKITSPGGEVLTGRDVNAAIVASKKPVYTFADNYFMSMGFEFFIQGEKRIITEQALGMVHRGSAGGISYYNLKLLRDAKQAELNILRVTPGISLEQLIPLEAELEQLNMIVDFNDKNFEETFKFLEGLKKTAKDKKKLQEIIDSLRKGDRDIFLTAEELINTGIATHVVKSVEDINESL